MMKPNPNSVVGGDVFSRPLSTSPLTAARTAASTAPRLGVWRDEIRLQTREATEFIDITDSLETIVRASDIDSGIVNVHVRHTSAALFVNENEPLLLRDLDEMLERWAPLEHAWHHDRFDIRTVNMGPGETANGHAHSRALVLGGSQTLNVVSGCLDLGRWQRVFLAELCGPRPRDISVLVMGLAGLTRSDLREVPSCE